jgi:hypothetical protein
MAQDSKADLNLDLPNLDLNLEDNKDDYAFDAKEDADSISKMIPRPGRNCSRLEVRQPKAIRGGSKAEKANTQGKQKAWKPITKQVTVVVEEVGVGRQAPRLPGGLSSMRKPPLTRMVQKRKPPRITNVLSAYGSRCCMGPQMSRRCW